MYSGSNRFSLDKQDIWNSVKGLLYTLAGATAVWLLGTAGAIAPTNAENVLYITLLSGAANILKQWVSDNSK